MNTQINQTILDYYNKNLCLCLYRRTLVDYRCEYGEYLSG